MSQRFPTATIAVVMPAYKAEKTLEQTLAAIPRDCIDEIILVDDASPDGTYEKAKELGIDVVIRHPENRGYGGNQKTCYTTALARGAQIVVMVHPDYQYDPTFIPALCAPLVEGKADAVFGSRMIHRRDALTGGMPWWKFVANIALTWIENRILGLSLAEYHSGFRAYSRRALERVPFLECHDDFIFDSEIIVQLRLAHLRITETPISTRYFPEASMISFRRSCRYGFAILWLMVQYLLHQSGLFRYQKFYLLEQPQSACPLCGANAHELDMGKLEALPLTTYAITEHSSGLSQRLSHCSSCDHVFTRDHPDATALHTVYAHQECDATYVAEEAGRRATARRILAHLATLVPSRGRGVDVGCGYGFFVDEARRAGWDLQGIEPGQESVAYATTRGIPVTQGSWDLLRSYPDASLHLITVFDVLEHLEDPKAFLALAAQKLHPAGCIVATLPKRDSFFARVMGSRWHAFLPSHLHYFSTRSLAHLIASCHLHLVTQRSYWRFFSLGYVALRATAYGGGFLRKMIAPVSSVVLPISLGDEFEVYSMHPAASQGQS